MINAESLVLEVSIVIGDRYLRTELRVAHGSEFEAWLLNRLGCDRRWPQAGGRPSYNQRHRGTSARLTTFAL